MAREGVRGTPCHPRLAFGAQEKAWMLGLRRHDEADWAWFNPDTPCSGGCAKRDGWGRDIKKGAVDQLHRPFLSAA
jgi:hypothetical protein